MAAFKPKGVRVYAPASISNLGSGFDVIGIAIDRPGDTVIAHRRAEPGIDFSVQSTIDNIPTDTHSNVAAYVATLLLRELRTPFGIRMVLRKQMPIGSGLGSSAASSVAAAVAVNALLPKPLKRRALLSFVVEGERKASGSPHADNAAPSLLGGVCLIRSYDPLDVVQINVPDSMVWVVVHPHVVVRTEEARAVLPKIIPLNAAIQQWGNFGGLMVGLLKGEPALVGKCVEDIIVEPARARLIPGFYDVKDAALTAGAFGCSISGSGPSVFAVTDSPRKAAVIAKAMAGAFRASARLQSDVYISRINRAGATILRTNLQ